MCSSSEQTSLDIEMFLPSGDLQGEWERDFIVFKKMSIKTENLYI
jgi:hypothetical protein